MAQYASISKRFLACIYELLLLIAIWLFFTWLFVMLIGHVDTSLKRALLQLLLWLVSEAYFVTCWVKTGQTPASQAWGLRLVDQNNQQLSLYCAIKRDILASLSWFFFGIGFLWAFVDKEHFFLHDRILGTRLIKCT